MAVPFGSTPGIIVGIGVGTAAAAAIEPVVEPARQGAWNANQNAILDAGTMARLVAQGGVPLGLARATNNRHGLTDDKTDQLVYLAQRMPGMGELDALSNRNLLTPADVSEVLTRQGIPPKWHGAFVSLFSELLPPADLARAIHRGLIPDPGLLQGKLPAAVGNVPAYPVYPINALQEAAGGGFDKNRLGVLVGLQGNPMGAHEAAQALFRNVLTYDDFLRAIAEGNTRNEWADAIMEQTRQIPTARDFLENALRGYSNLTQAIAGAARHGMSAADATLIYQNQGRPMNLHAITQALARGGTFQPEPGEITDPYMASIVEGNLKPAYYDLALANRYTLPSTFAMRQLAQGGVWDQAKTALRLKQAGWLPADADEVAIAWTAGTAAKADPYIAKAEGQLWTQIHKSYTQKQTIDRPRTDTELTTLVPVAADRTTILDLWTQERALAALG